jgi:hypothetical protein
MHDGAPHLPTTTTQGEARVLRAYDLEVRTVEPVSRDGLIIDRDGPVWRTLSSRGGVISYPGLDGLAGGELDAFIARQRDHFAILGQPVEWITYAHDAPADLPRRLITAGFVESEVGTVLIGRTEQVGAVTTLPMGVRLREVGTEAEFRGIADMEGAVWGIDAGWLVEQLTAQRAAQPDQWTFLVAEADGETISAGWTLYLTERFAALFGGATLPEWQRRGIYKALVARRARLAMARGHEFLVVDASDNSRPILERLGMAAIATRTSYTWKP